MKKYFSPWGGIIGGGLVLFPYFLSNSRNFIVYAMAIIWFLTIAYVIVKALKKRKESKTPEK